MCIYRDTRTARNLEKKVGASSNDVPQAHRNFGLELNSAKTVRGQSKRETYTFDPMEPGKG
jgi:hypothetical protein